MLRRSWTIVRQDLRLLRADPTFVVVMMVMPLGFMAFSKDSAAAVLSSVEGRAGVNGAEQVVPGGAVLFSMFLMSNVAFGVFREHGWKTWDRLRASPARSAEVMAGKVAVPLVVLAVQLTALFAAGFVLYDLEVRGTLVGVALVAAMFALSLVGLGLMLLALCRTVMQLNTLSNLGAMLLGGLGGAIAPVSALPGWARAAAPATPSYWAMRGFRSAILDPAAGVADVALPVAVLALFTGGFLAVAAWRFRFADTKISWA
jgi:ABC-2 type transport system permease protein